MDIREQVEVAKIKILIPSTSLLSCESLVSAKENTDRKRKKKEERKKIRIEHKPNWTLLT